MVKKKGRPKGSKNKRKPLVDVDTVVPKPFDLKSHLDITEEAEKFDLPVERVEEIAVEVQESSEPVLKMTLKQQESELRDRFYAIYNQQLEKFRACPFGGCKQELESIEVAISHIRLHLLMQAEDYKTARAIALDIEHQLFPQVEKSITAALGPDERAALVQRIREDRVKDLLQD
jgi:hypothetical protein